MVNSWGMEGRTLRDGTQGREEERWERKRKKEYIERNKNRQKEREKGSGKRKKSIKQKNT